MTDVRYLKKIASRITKAGVSRIKIDPHQIKNAEESITAADVRGLIRKGIITIEQKRGNSGFRIKKLKAQKKKGRRRGPGSVKGRYGARTHQKAQWTKNVRVLRREARRLRNEGVITRSTYRDVYKKIKGGYFRSRKHMEAYVGSASTKREKEKIKNDESA